MNNQHLKLNLSRLSCWRWLLPQFLSILVQKTQLLPLGEMTSSHSVNTSKQSHRFAALWHSTPENKKKTCLFACVCVISTSLLTFFQIIEAQVIALDSKPQVIKQTVFRCASQMLFYCPNRLVLLWSKKPAFYSCDNSSANLYVQHDPSRVSKILLFNSHLTVRKTATSC